MAIRAALTGHLLFTTLHTPTAAEGLFRLLDMGIKGYMLAAAVKGIVAQRLLRRLCPYCRKKVEIKAGSNMAKMLGDRFYNGMTDYEAVGCSKCGNTGYSGRIPIHEIMLMTDSIGQELKRKNVDFQRIKQEIYNNDMMDLWQDGLTKVNIGLTNVAELQRVLGIN